jgi:hypothetical protein
MAKAVVLFSGSLASIIATELVREAGIEEIRLLHFRSPFFRDYEPVKELAQSLWSFPFPQPGLKRSSRALELRRWGLNPFPDLPQLPSADAPEGLEIQ